MKGISDSVQSIITTISAILIVLGTIPTSGVPDEYRWIISIAGIIGLAIKEKIGAKESVKPTP